MKKLPQFSSEDEERRFWESHDSAEYLDWSDAEATMLPDLKPSSLSAEDQWSLTDNVINLTETTFGSF